MLKNFFIAIALIATLASCSSLKPLNFTSSKQDAPINNQVAVAPKTKFIEDISINSTPSIPKETSSNKKDVKLIAVNRETTINETVIRPVDKSQNADVVYHSGAVEVGTALQLKYSVLLNTEVEELKNAPLLQSIDEWYGTHYRMGGTTKKGIDCSAFVGAVYAAVYAVSLPRVARDQYKFTKHISRTELQEGDLLFFNTHGGVSHVGIYLQNNKFIHASVSKGVTISDMFEPYYLTRFIGAGRIENKQETVSRD